MTYNLLLAFQLLFSFRPSYAGSPVVFPPCPKTVNCPIDAKKCTCNGKGFLIQISWEEQDSNGFILSQRWKRYNETEKRYVSEKISYERDDQGRVTHSRFFDEKNILTRHDHITYDAVKNTTLQASDVNGDGKIDLRVKTTYTKDNAVILEETDRNNDGAFEEKCTYSPPCVGPRFRCENPTCSK